MTFLPRRSFNDTVLPEVEGREKSGALSFRSGMDGSPRIGRKDTNRQRPRRPRESWNSPVSRRVKRSNAAAFVDQVGEQADREHLEECDEKQRRLVRQIGRMRDEDVEPKRDEQRGEHDA